MNCAWESFCRMLSYHVYVPESCSRQSLGSYLSSPIMLRARCNEVSLLWPAVASPRGWFTLPEDATMDYQWVCCARRGIWIPAHPQLSLSVHPLGHSLATVWLQCPAPLPVRGQERASSLDAASRPIPGGIPYSSAGRVIELCSIAPSEIPAESSSPHDQDGVIVQAISGPEKSCCLPN